MGSGVMQPERSGIVGISLRMRAILAVIFLGLLAVVAKSDDDENSLSSEPNNWNLQDLPKRKKPILMPRPGKRSFDYFSSYDAINSDSDKREPQLDWRPGKKDNTGLFEYQQDDKPPLRPPRPGKKRVTSELRGFDRSISGGGHWKFTRPGKKRAIERL